MDAAPTAAPKPPRRITCWLRTTPADKIALKRLAAEDSVALGKLFDDMAASIYGSRARECLTDEPKNAKLGVKSRTQTIGL
jgi:hypothetical protein